MRQTRQTGAKFSGSEGDLNVIVMGKKTKQFLAQRAGDPELANLSRRARALIRSSQEHYNPAAVEEVLKEYLLRNEFRKGSIDGYTIDTVPLYRRGELKDELWRTNTNYGADGKWSPYLLSLKTGFEKGFWHTTYRYSYDRSLEDFERHAGLLADVAIYDVPDERLEATIMNPEFVRLIEMHDADPITPVISGKTGAGKSNFVLHLFRQSSLRNRGYISPAWGMRSRLRAYLPNMGDSDEKELKERVFPGIYSSYSYRFPWQIFTDRPKGSSIFWTKYDWSNAQEEEFDDSPGIFSMVYLGEVGLGKLKYAGSKEVALYKNLFQLTRQMKIRYYISSADPDPMPVGTMQDFINPQIWIEATRQGTRTAKAEYLEDTGRDMPAVVSKKLGTVPLDPLTTVMGKGIASDMTSSWANFPLQQMLEFSRVTNMAIYTKDPDGCMERATHFTSQYQDVYIAEVYPDIMNTVEKTLEIKNHHAPEEPEEDDDHGVDF